MQTLNIFHTHIPSLIGVPSYYSPPAVFSLREKDYKDWLIDVGNAVKAVKRVLCSDTFAKAANPIC